MTRAPGTHGTRRIKMMRLVGRQPVQLVVPFPRNRSGIINDEHEARTTSLHVERERAGDGPLLVRTCIIVLHARTITV
jgi:hypothetical protein